MGMGIGMGVRWKCELDYQAVMNFTQLSTSPVFLENDTELLFVSSITL